MLPLFTKRPLYTIGTVVIVTGSSTAIAQKQLDHYVAEALANNKTIKHQSFQLDKSLYALKEAQSYFMPSVTLLGSYVKSKGGRTIDFPIGDLLNPVYSSLNTLTESNNFPELQNQSIQLNPDNFYDAKIRTSLPLINSEIMINKKIKKEMISFQQATLNVYKRQLVKDIKTAYYQYSQADKAVAIYVNALSLVNENIRVNESLLRNGVRNGTALTRAKAEKEKIQASISEAINNRRNAQSYFNFLLNRALDESIILDSATAENPEIIILSNTDIGAREELQQVKSELSANALNKKLQQSYFMPTLNTFLDLGSQASDFKVDNKSQYYMFGINLQWDLFAGGQHTYKIKQAQADVKSSQLKYENTRSALEMQLTQTINNYNTAVANHQSAATQLTLATKYYNDQLRVYKEGQLLYIELLDAQNQITLAALQSSVAYSTVLIARAELERCQASYPLQ